MIKLGCILGVVIGLLTANIAYAGDIQGQVTIFQKGKDKPLKNFDNAVVYLEGLETPAPQEPAVMNQTEKKFEPRLLPVVQGQEVRFLNSDRLQHNVFSPHPEEPFDLGRYPKGEYKPFTFKVLGQHKIYCDIHQQMVGDVFVLPNRYFAVTDKTGRFTITAVPPGTYTLKVWHILGGEVAQPITVTEALPEVNFTVKSQAVTQQLEDHHNKTGKDYPPTY